ncbi:DUF3887 domain-containing protein [Bacillus sinesaloumensis]|uniref:DUF3887 domain-containing protein n=1 Tax=Litchfieldia sinesaloumensis TaxID=1926280 RepID=UPI0009887950|nr:DUF3887 domain-containing protein [Bacillus sinesaloumensis]
MRKIVLLVVSALLMLALVACGGNVDEATSEKYVSKAEDVISLLNEGKYGEVHDMFDNQMKVGLSEEQMEQLTPIIEQSGRFEKVDKSSIEEKDGYYVVVLVAKYSDENRIYTISFNENDEIAGLYIK